MKHPLTRARVRELFRYDPREDRFYRHPCLFGSRLEKPAGQWKGPTRFIIIDGRRYEHKTVVELYLSPNDQENAHDTRRGGIIPGSEIAIGG